MKKFITIIFMLSLLHDMKAQNVGIGTTTPAAKLDIRSNTNYVAQFNGTTAMYIGIFENDIYRGYWGSYAGAAEDVDFGTGAGNGTGKLHLTIQASPKLTIDPTGNVGIGTITPTSKLLINNADGIYPAFSITHPGLLGLSTVLQADRTLYHPGNLWINSGYGAIRYGYADQGWEWTTVNAGRDLQLWSYNPSYVSKAIRMYMNGTNGFIGIGTGNAEPNYILQVDAGEHSGIYSRSTITATDSAAIIGVLDVATGASFRSAGVRGESKSTTSSSIGVYGIQNGGGFGVAGSVKEAGISGWGAGVYGEAGLNGSSTGTGGYGVFGSNNNIGGTAGYFQDYTGNAASKALKTGGKIQLTGIGEAAGYVLTSDVNGNARWQASALAAHNHFGETWSGSALGGLAVINTSNANNTIALEGVANGATGLVYGVAGWSYSPSGIGTYGINSSFGSYASFQSNSGVAGSSGNGTGVYGGSISGAGIYGNSNTGYSVLGLKNSTQSNSAARFENQSTSNTSPVVQIVNAATNPTALELNNGYLKVSGVNKMAFTVTATVANSSGHILTLSYPNQDQTDIILVTHNFNPPGAPTSYISSPYSVYYNGTNWTIYLDNLSSILNQSFNVMVIKQ
jgi:hypothetical protein